MEQNIDVEEDDYFDGDSDPELDEQKGPKSGNSSPMPRGTEKMMIFCGMVGNFAYSRCLRFRFPFEHIIGISLQSDAVSSEKDVGALLILEVSRPPPADAFAIRMVHSRWSKDNEFLLAKDWTPDTAASAATRIYLYGGMKELKQTAALMAKKCPRLATMLSGVSCNSNSLASGSSLEYSFSPNFAVEESVTYGGSALKTSTELSSEDEAMLREDIRNALCRHCGKVYFRGHTGFPCHGCGDGPPEISSEPPLLRLVVGFKMPLRFLNQSAQEWTRRDEGQT